MIDFTILEYVLFWAALIVVFFVLRPHLPAWAIFALNVAFAFYCFVRILDDGPHVMRIVLMIMAVAAAATVWWRDLRSAARDGPPPGP
jgi:hypothetical protein